MQRCRSSGTRHRGLASSYPDLWRLKANEGGRLRKVRPVNNSGAKARTSREAAIQGWLHIGQALAASPDAQDVKLAAKYSRSCLMCHTSPDAKAPLVHDRANWQKRIAERGLDTVISHAQSGFNAMPPRGLCMDCTAEDYEAVIAWMSK